MLGTVRMRNPTQLIGSGALVQQRLVSEGACKLHMITGYNSGSDQFVHVFQTGGSLVANSVPAFSFPVASGQYFSFDFGTVGVDLDACTVANSTDAEHYTAGSADCSFQGIIAA